MEKISKLGILKGVAELAITAGVGVIVGNLVRATTPVESSRVTKVLVTVGGYGLTGVLGDLSGKYVANQIDNYGTKFRDLLHPVQEDAEEISEVIAEHATAAKDEIADIVNDSSTKNPKAEKAESEES
jgi:hypothetical protein